MRFSVSHARCRPFTRFVKRSTSAPCRKFRPVCKYLPKIRQFPLCLVCACFFDCLLGFRLTVGRNHRFSYPPFRFFFRRVPATLCQPLADFLAYCIGFPLFVHFKHFLFVSFSLYLYYTTNFAFVKRFLKIFLNFLKKIFEGIFRQKGTPV